MRKKFRPMTPMFLLLAALSFTACGGSGDEVDPLDRELDLAMAQDSLASLADTAMFRLRRHLAGTHPRRHRPGRPIRHPIRSRPQRRHTATWRCPPEPS
jgi:hypothetical protein